MREGGSQVIGPATPRPIVEGGKLRPRASVAGDATLLRNEEGCGEGAPATAAAASSALHCLRDGLRRCAGGPARSLRLELSLQPCLFLIRNPTSLK